MISALRKASFVLRNTVNGVVMVARGGFKALCSILSVVGGKEVCYAIE